jgi:hypothetical protein
MFMPMTHKSFAPSAPDPRNQRDEASRHFFASVERPIGVAVASSRSWRYSGFGADFIFGDERFRLAQVACRCKAIDWRRKY